MFKRFSYEDRFFVFTYFLFSQESPDFSQLLGKCREGLGK